PLSEQGEVVVVDERSLIVERSRYCAGGHELWRRRERHQQEVIDALLEIEGTDHAAQPLGFDQGLQFLAELVARARVIRVQYEQSGIVRVAAAAPIELSIRSDRL